MAIMATDPQHRLSGGVANVVPLLSIGRAKSLVESGANPVDDVARADALAGDVEYRCFYVHKRFAPTMVLSNNVETQVDTPSTDTTMDIGLAAMGLNDMETTLANENTAPAGGRYTAPSPRGTGPSIGDLLRSQHYGLSIRGIVAAGAAVYANSYVCMQCDANP